MRAGFFLLLAIASGVVATLGLKIALDHPWVYAVVVAGYAAAFALLHRVLKLGMAIGVAYGMWAAGGVVATAALSAVLFGETLTWLKITGMALIVAGVACVEMGARPRPQPAPVEVGTV